MKIYTNTKILHELNARIQELPDKERKHFTKHFNRLLYIPHKCIEYSFYDKSYDKKEFKKLSSTLLKKILTVKDYILVINYLKKWNIIECNDSYSDGSIVESFSKGYRINNNFNEQTITLYLNNDDDLVKRINNSKKEYKKFPLLKKEIKQYELFFGGIELDNSIIDHMKLKWGEKLLNNYYKYNSISLCGTIFPENLIGSFIQEVKNSNLIKEDKSLEHWILIMEDILDKYVRIHRCQKTGRVFNNFTSMPREMRQFLRYKGKRLKEKDCSNSQPLLLNIKLKEFYKDFEYRYDILNWIRLTSSGEIYEYLINEFNIDIDRQEFKEQFFMNIFYTKKKNWLKSDKNIYAMKFKELFPSIYEYILLVIDNHKYSSLPVLMQKQESYIWIDNIYRNSLKNNIKCITIHDSIMYIDNEIKLDKIIHNSFKIYNIIPKIKTKI